MVAIETHDLTKQYGTVLAVDDLSLSIPEGVVYGVLGPNGAGKTTMMRMLTTLTKPTSGSARVMGDPITDRLALVEHIGYLPEEPPLFDELSGHEQLDYIRGLRDLPLEPTQERIESLVDALDLEDYIDRRIATYSKGTRQKLAFVQILLHGPDVLFLDEPTEGLDPRAARTLRTMIDDLADEGTTIILRHTSCRSSKNTLISSVSSRMANSSPKERLPSFSAAPKPEKTLARGRLPRGNAGTPRRDAGARRRIGKPR